MTKIITTIRHASFVFDVNCGFAIYIDCKFNDGNFVAHYIDRYSVAYDILKILNKGKTGMAKDSITQESLNGLIGMKAIFTTENGNKMTFQNIEELT